MQKMFLGPQNAGSKVTHESRLLWNFFASYCNCCF